VRFAGILGLIPHAPAHYRDDGHWPPPLKEEPVLEADLARWRVAYPEATCSDRIARLLAGLMRDFGPHAAG